MSQVVGGQRQLQAKRLKKRQKPAKKGQLSEELSEEISRSDVPVTFPMNSFTGLPEALNPARCASVILRKGTHERAVLFV
jgi:hypothetical protein